MKIIEKKPSHLRHRKEKDFKALNPENKRKEKKTFVEILNKDSVIAAVEAIFQRKNFEEKRSMKNVFEIICYNCEELEYYRFDCFFFKK